MPRQRQCSRRAAGLTEITMRKRLSTVRSSRYTVKGVSLRASPVRFSLLSVCPVNFVDVCRVRGGDPKNGLCRDLTPTPRSAYPRVAPACAVPTQHTTPTALCLLLTQTATQNLNGEYLLLTKSQITTSQLMYCEYVKARILSAD